jgi:antitoxin HigA-1
MTRKALPPVHPGEILLEEFMKPLGISQNQLARDLNVPPRRINEIVHGKRSITIDTALRLSRHFGTSVEFWINLQTHYELEVAEDNKLAERISREVSPRVEAGASGNGGAEVHFP